MEVAKATLVARDGLTGDHSDDVCLLCEELADELDIDDDTRASLMAAAQLHDIGKVAVPEAILHKPGPLTESEWNLVRDHTPIGASILSAVPELSDVAKVVLHSHEQWDGSGYPDGLAGDEIPLASRIILCADAFHAIRSTRPYRRGRPARAALAELKLHAGTHFDPAVVDAMERVVGRLRKSPPELFAGVRAATRSRRLMVLLLTLGVAGSALAALHGGSLSPDDAAVADADVHCAGGACLPIAATFSGRLVPRSSDDAGPPGASRSSRRAGQAGVDGAPLRRRPSSRRPARAPLPLSAPVPLPRVPSAAPVRAIPGQAGRLGKRGGHAYAYGHRKRRENPHPPKLPPGRMKPKPAP
ncbi:MAG: HD-GYP domain-containing protein [Thermoleophilaceae bacterium]